MKIVLFLIFCSYNSSALSQNKTSGIYLTAEDFKNNKLAFSSACPAGKKAIQFQNQKRLFLTPEVFAVKICQDIFRIQNNSRFKIINPDIIPLYSQSVSVGGDGYFYEDAFFFSVKPDSEILPLTKSALAKAFTENQKFIDLINSSFKNEKKLMTFNKHLNKYMLIYYYEKSIE